MRTHAAVPQCRYLAYCCAAGNKSDPEARVDDDHKPPQAARVYEDATARKEAKCRAHSDSGCLRPSMLHKHMSIRKYRVILPGNLASSNFSRTIPTDAGLQRSTERDDARTKIPDAFYKSCLAIR
jgi:hypothetical protein